MSYYSTFVLECFSIDLNTLPVDSGLAIGRRVIAGLFCVYIALKKSTIMEKISHLISPF